MDIYVYVYVYVNEHESVTTMVQALAICIHTYIYIHTLHHGDEYIWMYKYVCICVYKTWIARQCDAGPRDMYAYTYVYTPCNMVMIRYKRVCLHVYVKNEMRITYCGCGVTEMSVYT